MESSLNNSCGGEICLVNEVNEVPVDNYISVLEDIVQKASVNDELAAYKLYCQYAHVKGFSVRKGKGEYFAGTTNMRSKLFTCSKEGLKNKSIDKPGKGLPTKLEERTCCQARIWFKHEIDGPFKVSKWVKEHNHDMAEPETRHLLRSSRSIGRHKGNLIDSHLNAGVRLIDSYNMIVEDCGGDHNVGYTKKDLYNFANLLQMSKIEAGDCQSVIDDFKKRENEDALFYWDVQLDTEGRVANIFWRDSRARYDYEFFGDFVTFDTTYRTNKYGLICAPFVGVNHHHGNVLFGCGFLSDETIVSFKWLFSTFLESMSGKQPKTLFTDQDAAMLNVVPKVFPNSWHRLCQWHISKNAPSHLPNQPGLQNYFNKCMNGCDSVKEFQEIWSKMHKYNLYENSWLNNMYNLRHKWSSAFNCDTFYAGLKSTSRSESTNRALNRIADRTTCLYQFVNSFESLVNKWRIKERDEDHRCHQGMPTLSIETSEMLKNAANVYTCTIYKFFEKEYAQGVGASDLRGEVQCDYAFTYEIALQGDVKVRTVIFDAETMDIKCSCCKFETTGILCSHAWKVLNMKNVHIIPEKYLLTRWRKDAKNRVKHLRSIHNQQPAGNNESEMVYSNRLMRFSHDLVQQSKANAEARMILETALEEAETKINTLFEKENLCCETSGIAVRAKCDQNEAHVLDPLYVKPKGVSKERIQSH